MPSRVVSLGCEIDIQCPPAPEDSEIWDILNEPYPHDFSEIETINGDLLHGDNLITDSDYGASQ